MPIHPDDYEAATASDPTASDDLSVFGLGARHLNPNIAPPGQHANVELPTKLAQARALAQEIAGRIQALRTAQSQLEASFWSGSNFTNFIDSTNAWNAMDAAITSAQKVAR